jgi:hypothetical protein
VTTPTERTYGAADAVAGFLATCAIVVSLLALVTRPMRLAPAAILVALLATAMSRRNERMATVALATGGVCFILGAVIAIATNKPLF